MAAYAMAGCYDTYPSVRPNARRTVTATNKSPKAAKTPQAASALPKHLPTVLCSSHIQPLEQVLRPPMLVSEHPTQASIPTVNRGAYDTVEDLCSFLETHSLFRNYAGANAVNVLCISGLPPLEYLEVYKLLAPLLEDFRIRIDFQDTTLILRRPSEPHQSGAGAWKYLIDLLESQMRMTPKLQKAIRWTKGQLDVSLPPLSKGGLRIKTPDASLGRAGQHIPTLVLETAYSQTVGKAHKVAKTWLYRLINDGIEALEEHAVQCVILFNVNYNLSKHWLPAFCDSLQRQDPNIIAPDPALFLSKADLQSIALSVEIWRNEKDATTGAMKCEHTVRDRATCTIPVCISTHEITTQQLFDTWIWGYLSEVHDRTKTFKALQDLPPIPRSTISQNQQTQYFTLYLDDLTSPKDIPQNLRGMIWVNVPLKMWVWEYLLSEEVVFEGWGGLEVDDWGEASAD